MKNYLIIFIVLFLVIITSLIFLQNTHIFLTKINYDNLNLVTENYSLKYNTPGCSFQDNNRVLLNEGIVIRTQEEYDSFLNSFYSFGYDTFQINIQKYPETYISVPNYTYKEFFDKCNIFPDIDFSQKTLLGKQVNGQCSVNFIKEVYKDDSKKQIIYSIKVKEKGNCLSITESPNLILIPKIPSDYIVKIEVN